jgi:hypothetical protein
MSDHDGPELLPKPCKADLGKAVVGNANDVASVPPSRLEKDGARWETVVFRSGARLERCYSKSGELLDFIAEGVKFERSGGGIFVSVADEARVAAEPWGAGVHGEGKLPNATRCGGRPFAVHDCRSVTGKSGREV